MHCQLIAEGVGAKQSSDSRGNGSSQKGIGRHTDEAVKVGESIQI